MTTGAPLRQCRICQAQSAAPTVSAREMMFGTREAFAYWRCAPCGTLQIAEIPADPGRFYAASAYYSFNNRRAAPWHRTLLKRLAAASMVGHPQRYPRGHGPLARIRRGAEPWTALVPGLSRRSAVLDLGCGEGARLDALAGLGFSCLTGVDPFLPPDQAGLTAAGVRLIRGELSAATGQFDCITMHHSLEHFPDPGAVLATAVGMLRPGGHVLVRIPLLQPQIWDHFGAHWAQLDAPRHFHLFAPAGFIALARRNRLACIASGTDMLGWSLAWSAAYARDMPMFAADGSANPLPCSASELAAFERQAASFNRDGIGDQGYFVLRPA